jgi:hypothetical protein
MRSLLTLLALTLAGPLAAAELESRVFTHYVPQDFLEKVVRSEGWVELPLPVKGGLRKGDVVRVWAGGLIDRGNGDQPGENVAGPEGAPAARGAVNPRQFALSAKPGHAYALLIKTEPATLTRCMPAGKPREIPLRKDREKVWLGFNDERGRYADNHLGKGRRHERSPLWLRIEVVRTIVD